MNKLRNILLLGLLVCCTAVSGQTYEGVLRRNFWNDSRNIAGIRLDSLSRSYAELYGGYESGGFRSTWQAEEGWNAGAATASIKHWDKVSMKGSFSFDQTEGYGMCGSMFIEPGYYPVDVLEFTPGRKTRQTYAFDGGLAFDINDMWTIGAKMDFMSANYAKLKDLRYTDWKLDMTVAPAVMFRSGDFVAGASPVFRKTSETIDATQIGTSESSYYAFFDKGLMYGISQVWTGSGVHLAEAGVNGLPVKEFHYGAAAQAQYKGLYMSFEYMKTQGTVGEKEYIWFRFPGSSVAADLGYKLQRGVEDHYFRLDFDWKMQDMDESVLEKVNENGVVNVLNHGSNRIFSRETMSVVPEYEYVSDKVEVLASVGLAWKNGVSSQVYPYVCTRSLMNMSARVKALVHMGDFDLGATLGYGAGKVSESEFMTDADITVQSTPQRLKDWYDREIEYETASRVVAGMSIRHNFAGGIYVEASADWMHGFDLLFVGGNDRVSAGLKLGYMF